MPLINHIPELVAWKYGNKKASDLQDIATATQLSHSTVLRWSRERQIDLIEASVLAAWCHYFGVSVGQILEYVPDDAPL